VCFSERIQTVIKDIQIFVATTSMLNTIISVFRFPVNLKKIIKAKFPIFENIDCPSFQSLITIALGCDINLYPKITPKEILDTLKTDNISKCLPCFEKDNDIKILKK
jgi:hypothetical protein